MKRHLKALSHEEGGELILAAPRVGVLKSKRRSGELVSEGELLGELEILGLRHQLSVPGGVIGTLERAIPVGPVHVEYKQTLFSVRPLEGGPQVDAPTANQTKSEDSHAVKAPIHGIFYLRPDPDAGPFVTVGDRVQEGQTLGLIEVMKTFHPVTWSDPASGQVLSINVVDGEEVEADRTLLRIRVEP